MVAKSDYTGKDIKELPFPESVQKRPQMYIGTTDNTGMLTCIREILNNSVDEFLAGHANKIVVTRINKTSFSIQDDGRGVPFDVQPDGCNTMEMIFGRLHAGRNFDEAKTVYSTGLNGVGASCVNALSEWFTVTSQRDTTIAQIAFSNGVLKGDVVFSKAKKKGQGTTVLFTFNKKFFEAGAEVDIDALISMLRETAALSRGLTIVYEDKEDKPLSFTVKGDESSLEGLLYTALDTESSLFTPAIFPNETINKTQIQVAFGYNNGFARGDNILSFCNTINTEQGGTHVSGFKRALVGKVASYINENKLSRDKILPEDVYMGLHAVVSVMVFNPKYTSQTKQCLNNNEVSGHVVTYMNKHLQSWMESHPKEMKILATHLALAAKARISQKRALENVKRDSSSSLFTSMSDPTKFVDCLSRDNLKRELLICEGASAGGTVSDARNKLFQAIYKLRGKVLNVLDKPAHVARKNKEVDDLFSILKCGTGENFDLDKCAFGRIVFLTDADADGSHIELLLLTLMHEYWRPLIEDGRVYIAVSPLYRITQNGKPPIYLKNEDALNKFYLEHTESVYDFTLNGKPVKGKSGQDFIAKMKYYKSVMDEIADEFNVNPHVLESALFPAFVDADYDLRKVKLPKSISVETNGETISMTGLSRLEHEEVFLCLMNANIEWANEAFGMAVDALIDIQEYEISPKRGKLDETSWYNTIERLFEGLRKSVTVTRFKGLGESSAEDLWTSTLNPETRTLIQVQSADNFEEIVRNFMDDATARVAYRKAFLQKVFSEIEA